MQSKDFGPILSNAGGRIVVAFVLAVGFVLVAAVVKVSGFHLLPPNDAKNIAAWEQQFHELSNALPHATYLREAALSQVEKMQKGVDQAQAFKDAAEKALKTIGRFKQLWLKWTKVP